MSVLDNVSLPPGADPKECIKEGFGILNKILDGDINPRADEVVAGFEKVLNLTNVEDYSVDEFGPVMMGRLADISQDDAACHVLGLLVNLGVAAVIVERDRRKAGGIKGQFEAAMDKLEQKLRSRGN